CRTHEDPLRGEMAGEGAALADDALHLELAAVPLQDVLDDGEPESGPAGGARAARIDAIEALREARNVLGRYADAGVGYGEMATVLIHPPAHLDGTFRRGVFGGVVDQVGEGGVDLRLLADERRGVGIDSQPHFPRVRGAGEHV